MKKLTQSEREERYAAMRKKNARARKRIQKQLCERSQFIERLMEVDPQYSKEHALF